ncbi:MAG TPA: DNA-binding domain-containing protein [Vineibacter sp.]|nr:DNA-binding domain-containing protein [Vineibacter sp.]
MSALSLAELQSAFRGHVLGDDSPALIAAAIGDRIPAAARLRVYRHHVLTSLAAALGTTFTTVRGVVGDDFFATMARAFISQSPPTGPVLSEYGASFANFVAVWPAAGGLPYLADVARLDWALNVAYIAPDQTALTAERLAAMPPDALGDLRPGLRAGVSLLRSAYPIDRIWALNHGGSSDSVDLSQGSVALLVFPRPADAAFASLDLATALLAEALAEGLSLAGAVEHLAAADAGGDFSAALGLLLSLQALAEPASPA